MWIHIALIGPRITYESFKTFIQFNVRFEKNVFILGT